MREILFRGKRMDNAEWVEGNLINGTWYLDEEEIVVIVPLGNTFYSHCEISEWHEVDPDTVGQFTGLTDKNGKKIFEGDIVAIERGWNETVKYHVFFDPQICGFVGDSINYVGFTTFEDDGVYMTVIGNAHDNPELLEGEG